MKRCKGRESGGVQCEREEGHEGPHECPRAVEHFERTQGQPRVVAMNLAHGIVYDSHRPRR